MPSTVCVTGDEIGQRMRDHLGRLDADENGVMTLDEFRLGMQTMYSHFDRRGRADGTLGAGEQANQLFAPDRVVEVEISLPEEDWQSLCEQSRDTRAAFANPTDKPFSYFKGNITIDGVSIQQVGIRKKGFIGSLDKFRPSLKIKFSEYSLRVRLQRPLSHAVQSINALMRQPFGQLSKNLRLQRSDSPTDIAPALIL